KACRRTTGGTGPQPRAVARRTRASEHGEHGEDPPFPRRPPPGLEGASDRGGDARTAVRALFRPARGSSWLRKAPAAPLPCRQRIVPDDTIERSLLRYHDRTLRRRCRRLAYKCSCVRAARGSSLATASAYGSPCNIIDASGGRLLL